MQQILEAGERRTVSIALEPGVTPDTVRRLEYVHFHNFSNGCY